MKTLLGFITGIFVGALGFTALLITVDDGDKIIKDAHNWIQ